MKRSELRFRWVTLAIGIGMVGIIATPAHAQKKKATPKPAPKNQTKGQNQLVGGLVKFGEIYSLKNGFNFEILSAHYTVESFPCYQQISSKPSGKVVVLDLAFKNATPKDLDLGDNDMIYLMDSNGNKYSGQMELTSNKTNEFFRTLKPGQGLGQPGLNDPLRMGFEVPTDAVITKIFCRQPRLGKSEELLRYLMAGTDKEADPKNVIAPLPEEVRDPADKSGAVALAEGKGVTGKFYPYGLCQIKVEGIERVDSLTDRLAKEDGKQYVLIAITIRNSYPKAYGTFDIFPQEATLKDEDGNKYPVIKLIKKSKAEDFESSTLDPGETTTFRLVYQTSSGAKLTTMKYAGQSYPWMFDLTKN